MKISLFLYLSLTLLAGSLAASDHEVFRRADTIDSGKDIFYLYTRNNSVPDKIRAKNFTDLDKSHFQPEKQSFIIIGDIIHDYGIPKAKNIRPALLQVKDLNVFNLAYPSVLHTDNKNPILKIGRMVANFIKYIHTNYGAPISNFNFIGYHLGPFIAAYAGNLLEGQIATIVALDPNKDKASTYPLNYNSSTKVITLHTSLGGVQTNVGNVDIYFNDARYQPNCGLDKALSCAHFRAYIYCGRAILDPDITATTCDSYANFVGGACDSNEKVSIGSLIFDGTPPGTYYSNYTV